MLELLIARHGNTFDKGDVVLRVGARTDLPLSISGSSQAKALGKHLKQHYPSKTNSIDAVFTSKLKRTIQTAEIALADYNLQVEQLEIFNEIDYGDDDGKSEELVVNRIGRDALALWDNEAIVPNCWDIDINLIIENWQKFASTIINKYLNYADNSKFQLHGKTQKNILIVTSNGIARFAPKALLSEESYNEFIKNNKIKLGTGSISSLIYKNNKWDVKYWNVKPDAI